MKKEVTRLDVMSVALVYGASLAVMGLFFALLFLIFGSLFNSLMGRSSEDAVMGSGIAILVLFPLLYGALGLVLGAISAFIYNLVAPRVGGVKVYVRDAVN